MNTPEGIRRIAKAIKWVGDGLGAIAGIGLCAMFAIESQTLTDGALAVAVPVVIGLLICGAGRLLSWIIMGFAESSPPAKE